MIEMDERRLLDHELHGMTLFVVILGSHTKSYVSDPHGPPSDFKEHKALWPTEGTFADENEVMAFLRGGHDDGAANTVLKSVWSEGGATATDITTEIAEALAHEAWLVDNHDHGIPPDNRPWVHPMAFDRAGFEWTLTAHEWEEIMADQKNEESEE